MISALHRAGYPVPRPLSFCADSAVLGTEFYLMEFVAGRIFRDPALPGMTPAERATVFEAMAEALAGLHAIDWRALGLGDFGRTEKFAERQVTRLWHCWHCWFLATNLAAIVHP